MKKKVCLYWYHKKIRHPKGYIHRFFETILAIATLLELPLPLICFDEQDSNKFLTTCWQRPCYNTHSDSMLDFVNCRIHPALATNQSLLPHYFVKCSIFLKHKRVQNVSRIFGIARLNNGVSRWNLIDRQEKSFMLDAIRRFKESYTCEQSIQE